MPREIKTFSGEPNNSCGSSSVLFALSIALGIALIVVIILIIVYATKRDNQNGKTGTIDIVTVEPLSSNALKPLELQGPLSLTDYKHVNPSQATDSHAQASDTPVEARDIARPSALSATEPKPSPQILTAAEVMAYINNNAGKTYPVAIVSNRCGACRALKAIVQELDNPQLLSYIDASELANLDKSTREALSAQYIPQFVKLGPNGNIQRGKTGVMKKEELLSYISSA